MNQLPVYVFPTLLLVCSLGVLWGLLSPVHRLPAWTHRHDKLFHAGAFGMLALLTYGCWPAVHRGGLWLALTLFGLAGEALQELLATNRRFCWRDAAANAAGAAIVLCLV